MLVLTRKTDEKIRIGDDVVITVLRTKGKAVRLGIEAPGDVRVLRGEIAFEGEETNISEYGEEQQSVALHARVPRDRISSVLPELTTASGPLASFVGRQAVGQ